MNNAYALVCKIVGHDPHYFRTQYVHHGRWRTGSGCFCTRCGVSNSERVHTPGTLHYLTDWRFYFRNAALAIAGWYAAACSDCGKVSKRLGCSVGDHSNCQDWLHIIEKAPGHDK